jgi:hypothetical protein
MIIDMNLIILVISQVSHDIKSLENKHIILETFLKAFEFSQKITLPFYIVDDYNLQNYTTTKKNLK